MDNFYSRLVAWMKIILPLTALALLSTLFLISETVDPDQSLPTASIDLASRAEDQGATNATFAGMTQRGDEIKVTTASARPTSSDPRLIEAFDIVAEFKLISGTLVDVVSDTGDVHQSELTASLEGNVNLVSTTGYEVNTDRMEARLDVLYAETPGAVTGKGPPGTLEAGRMILTENAETGAAYLRFTDGVKLVYQPEASGEN